MTSLVITCPSFFLTVPDRKPRTLWFCHPVEAAISLTVVPLRLSSIFRIVADLLLCLLGTSAIGSLAFWDVLGLAVVFLAGLVMSLFLCGGVMNHDTIEDNPICDHHEIAVPFSLRRRGVEARLIVGDCQVVKAVDHILVATIARALAWFQELASGNKASINDIARDQGLAANEISRLLPLAFLAPDIVEAIMSGTQPMELTTKRLKRFDSLPLDWQQQRTVLGFPSAALR